MVDRIELLRVIAQLQHARDDGTAHLLVHRMLVVIVGAMRNEPAHGVVAEVHTDGGVGSLFDGHFLIGGQLVEGRRQVCEWGDQETGILVRDTPRVD